MRKLSILIAVFAIAMVGFGQQEIRTGRSLNNNARNEAETEKPNETSSLKWDQTEVDIILQAYGERTHKTILKDPQIQDVKITLKSQPGQKLSDEDYLEAIRTILEMNQIHLEPYGESFIRAVPRKNAHTEGIPIIMNDDAELGDTTKVVSMWVKLKNMSVDDAKSQLDPIKSSSGILLGFKYANSLLITDTEQNINRMLDIIKVIDVATPVNEVVEYIQIKYANASEVKQVLDNIVLESQKEQEKSGAAQNQQSNNNGMRPMMPGGRLLGRPGANNAQQPQAPSANESLVMSVSDADRGMIRGKVVTIADERSNKILIITNPANMKFFKEVIAALDVETTPDVQVKVYRLKYAEAEDVSDMINDLIGNSVSSKGSGKSNTNQNAAKGTSGSVTRNTTTTTNTKSPANQRSGEAKAGELNKDNVTVLADKRINGLVVMARKEDIPTIESIIESMDIKLSQVLIETAIIEVTLGDDLSSGVDWVRLGNKQPVEGPLLGPNGLPMYNFSDGKGGVRQYEYTGTDTIEDEDGIMWNKFGDALTQFIGGERSGYWTSGASGEALQYALGGGGGTMAGKLFDITSGVTTNLFNPTGSGLNYFFKSDRLNLGAVIQATKTDSRSKYIASPVVMTVDNKEATIEATEARKFFNGYETSSSTYNYIRTPKYDSKDIGITIKVTPKINPNGTVMLTIEEEYSQLGSGQSILVDDGGTAVIDTSLTRKMSADILLDNMQTVVLGGLTENFKSSKETGIPILKDIPLIGKWLFGSVTETENRKELLVFMTPYVLSDSDAAQAEAIRRKRALSDSRPWDNNGWSLSELADPVSRKEQMRRIKDEWAKQDEERKTKIAIEKMKVDRAKELQKMTQEERDLWLNMHKEELEEEAQKELEEKMLDDQSQDELKALAEKIRKEKLEAADKELKAAEELTISQTERAKYDAEQAAKAEKEAE